MKNISDIERLRRWSSKFFIDCDSQTFDIDSEIDSTLTFEENKCLLKEKIITLVGSYNPHLYKNKNQILEMILPYQNKLSHSDKIRPQILRNLLKLKKCKIIKVSEIMKNLKCSKRVAYDYHYTLIELEVSE
jgi:hypothetical protein